MTAICRVPRPKCRAERGVASATWSEGWNEPFARAIAGKPYWLMFRGDIDASHYSDSRSRPVEMRCLHLYAAPAQPDSGQYRKPSPRLLGFVRWPGARDGVQALPQPESGQMTERKTAGRLSIFHKTDAGNVPAPWVPPEVAGGDGCAGSGGGKTRSREIAAGSVGARRVAGGVNLRADDARPHEIPARSMGTAARAAGGGVDARACPGHT